MTSIASRPAPPATPGSEAAQRTYEVRTYGCQMNVHDSERLSGLLEDAGYARADTEATPRRRRGVQHLRGPRERRQQALRQPRAPRAGQGEANKGMQIAVGGCLAQKDRSEITRRAPWVDVVFGTHNIGSLPALLERARIAERGSGRDPRVARGVPVDAADPARVRVRRLGRGQRRLQQHLHVLHRAVAARH